MVFRVSTYISNMPWLNANEITATYLVNGMFFCLGNGCSSKLKLNEDETNVFGT